MNIAVLTLTRDRLDYTKHCFASLDEFAGCSYDHYVLDQASTDGTADWLLDQEALTVMTVDENVGISRGLNLLLDEVVNQVDYDVIVKFDNDCELTQPNTLTDVADLAYMHDLMLSPRICGLQNPPAATGTFTVDDETILNIPQIGGIFLAAPSRLYESFRFNERNPTWGGDDVEVCRYWRITGRRCGYVERLEAWHYETTGGQQARFGDYFARKHAEMAA